MTTGWQHYFCFKLHSSISVHCLFYFRVGLISDTVTGTGAWFSDTPTSVNSFLGRFPQIGDYRVSRWLPFAIQQFSPDFLFDVY